MITEDFTNKMKALFPQMTNDNALGSASGELWKGVSEKYADGVKKIIAPVKDCIMDVQTDLQVRNPDACPVVQVEVIESMGEAMIDGTNWNKSDIKNKYVDVKLHRVSRPFKLTAYDIMKGERIESKVKSAMEAVAQGVCGLMFAAIASSGPSSNLESPSQFGPEAAVRFQAQTPNGADRLIVNPVAYSKLVPTNGLGLDPSVSGVYGYEHIYKCDASLLTTASPDTGEHFAVAFENGSIAGAVATPEILLTNNGQGAQFLGEIAGIPMILISSFDYDTQTVKCSVETLAGFAVTDINRIFVAG